MPTTTLALISRNQQLTIVTLYSGNLFFPGLPSLLSLLFLQPWEQLPSKDLVRERYCLSATRAEIFGRAFCILLGLCITGESH